MDSADYLVIILSVGMSLLILLVIIALIYTIKILRHVNNITEKAENIANNVDTVSEFFKKSAGPMAVGKLIMNIIEHVKKQQTKKE